MVKNQRRLEIFDMEFTNTEFTQFSLSVVLIRVVEFRYNYGAMIQIERAQMIMVMMPEPEVIMMMCLQGNPSEQISMGKPGSGLGQEGHQD